MATGGRWRGVLLVGALVVLSSGPGSAWAEDQGDRHHAEVIWSLGPAE